MSLHVRQILKISTVFLIAIATACCSSAARHGLPLTSNQLYKSIKTFVDSSGTRTIVLIPMEHVAKPTQYKKINDYLDTLKSHGYVTFGEGLVPSDKYTDTLDLPLVYDVYDLYSPVDSMKFDTLRRKMRKILGINLSSKYDNMATRRHLVAQDSVVLLFGERDYWVDETYADFIKDFEMRYGEIELSPYDFECPLDSDKYKGKEDRRWKSIRTGANAYCNNRVAKCVLNSDFDKIAVVYGYSHIHTLYWFVLPNNGYIPADNPYYQ